MTLMSCPACGRGVSAAAVACPQCGQPIAGVVAPPPAPLHGGAFEVDALKIDAAQRANAAASNSFRRAVIVACVLVLAVAWVVTPRPGSQSPSPKRPSDAAARARALAVLQEASSGSGIEYITWQGTTLQIVMPRLPGDTQALADAACTALRAQGVRGYARVAVLERNAYLNARREYLGEATCSLPP